MIFKAWNWLHEVEFIADKGLISKFFRFTSAHKQVKQDSYVKHILDKQANTELMVLASGLLKNDKLQFKARSVPGSQPISVNFATNNGHMSNQKYARTDDYKKCVVSLQLTEGQKWKYQSGCMF